MKTITVLATLLILPAVTFAKPADCERLTSLTLPGARVVSAEWKTDHCEVKGIATPVPASRIGFTVLLPAAERWSQRLHMVGNGGYSSRIYVAQLEARIKRGDVAVAY